MQQMVFPRFGPPSIMQLKETPDPEPGPGEVRVQVKAAGVNFADLMARMGIYPDAPPLPMVVGYEVSGVVDKLGEGVSPEWLGKSAIAMCRFGGYSTAVVVKEVQLAELPAGMDHAVAAAIPVTGVTAWMMLEEMGRVREGDRVLVHSAGGGVGLMALDLLKWRGATAIGTASAGKHDFLRERGYDQLIDYRNEDFEQVLKDAPGLDLILDPVGGASWKKGLNLLRSSGRLVCFGFSANATSDKRSLVSLIKNMSAVPWLSINPITLMNENKGVMGVNMGHMWDEAERITGWLQRLLQLWTVGTLRPVVHARVPFAEAAEAHRILHDRENVGKVVLVMP